MRLSIVWFYPCARYNADCQSEATVMCRPNPIVWSAPAIQFRARICAGRVASDDPVPPCSASVPAKSAGYPVFRSLSPSPVAFLIDLFHEQRAFSLPVNACINYCGRYRDHGRMYKNPWQATLTKLKYSNKHYLQVNEFANHSIDETLSLVTMIILWTISGNNSISSQQCFMLISRRHRLRTVNCRLA